MRTFPEHDVSFRTYDQDFLVEYEADAASLAMGRGVYLRAEGVVEGRFELRREGRLTAQGVEPGSWYYCVYPLFEIVFHNETDTAQVLEAADTEADVARCAPVRLLTYLLSSLLPYNLLVLHTSSLLFPTRICHAGKWRPWRPRWGWTGRAGSGCPAPRAPRQPTCAC